MDVIERLCSLPKEGKTLLAGSPIVKEGPILQGKGKKVVERYLFLCGCYLVVCKKQKSNGRHEVCYIIRLRNPKTVSIVTDSTYPVKDAEFRLYSLVRTFIFFIPDTFSPRSSYRDDWVNHIKKQFIEP